MRYVDLLIEDNYDDHLPEEFTIKGPMGNFTFTRTHNISESSLEEAEYQGRKVKLNKPMAGDVKKSKVYVKDPKTGNVKKVNFGHGGSSVKGKSMKIKKNNSTVI